MAIVHTRWPKPPVKKQEVVKKPEKKIVKEKSVVKETPVIAEPSIEDFLKNDEI